MDRMDRFDMVMLTIALKLSIFIDWLKGEFSPRSERWMFWTLIIASLPVGYLMASALCALDSNSCLIANAAFADWIFGK